VEVKCLGLILIFIYTFFKFAWAYRLFNYVAILFGAMPPAAQRDTAEAEAMSSGRRDCSRAPAALQSRPARVLFRARLSRLVRQPLVLFVTTAAVVIVIWRRQFVSNAWQAMGS